MPSKVFLDSRVVAKTIFDICRWAAATAARVLAVALGCCMYVLMSFWLWSFKDGESLKSRFVAKNRLWKYNYCTFWQTVIQRTIHKIWWFPLSMLILDQKSCFLGPTMFEIPQPNWHYYVCFFEWEGWICLRTTATKQHSNQIQGVSDKSRTWNTMGEHSFFVALCIFTTDMSAS